MDDEAGEEVVFTLISDTLDKTELANAASSLVKDLRRSGIDVRKITSGDGIIPEGAKAGFPIELASAFAIGLAGTALQEVVKYAWMWLRHRKHPQNIQLNLSTGSFQLSSSMSPDEVQTLVDTLEAVQRVARPNPPSAPS